MAGPAQIVSPAIDPLPYPHTPDQGDGTFRNPVLMADYSDPDVIRDGADFWLTASSFNCTPGLPILHSRDLVNWTIVNHAVRNNPDPRGVFHTPRHGEGVWAPAIRKHAGKFWIFFPMPDEGIYVTTATDPRGRWTEPRCVLEGKGLIDPCPLWDDDGHAWLVHAFARSRAGIKDKLRVMPMEADASGVLGEGRVVFDEPVRHVTCEGPKFHKRNGYYYISAPAGGVPTGWQLILRSRFIYGPYEEKVVLAQGSTPINGPHQGALVDDAKGDWWFVHFQELQPYGRICHLQPVKWVNDWPLIGVNQDANGTGEPVLRYRKPASKSPVAVQVPQTTDEFDGDALGLQWQWHANHPADPRAWHEVSGGALKLHAVATPADLWETPNLLLQKPPAATFTVETKLALHDGGSHAEAGLIVMGIDHAAVVVRRSAKGVVAALLVKNEPVATQALSSASARLRVRWENGGRCTFAVAGDGGTFEPIGGAFQAVEGKWIGAKIGVFCRTPGATAARPGAHAAFEYFRFSA